MPRISEFFGIAIYMHWRDHAPPHFHAHYGGREATIAIDDLTVLSGRLPPRVMGLVMEWSTIHHGELLDAWRKATNLQPLGRIDPLQ